MKTKEKKVLLLGAGDIGRRIIARITPGFAVTAVTSQAANRSPLKRLGATAVSADLDRPRSLVRLPSDWQILIHCAPPPARGSRDSRTRNLLRSVALRHPERAKILTRVMVYLSTSGVYGDCGGAVVSEARPLRPGNARARRRVDAERQLVRVARQRGMHLIILRVPGIYAVDRLPLARLKAGTPAIVAAEDAYTNHVHAADLAAMTVRAMHHALRRRPPRVRVYNANDDSDLKMGDYFDLVAQAFGLPAPPRLPRAAIAGAVSPMLLSFMRESRRLDNSRQKRELRLAFQFPTVADGLSDMRRLA